ncbi:proline/glycine betaine ABC transporter permease [Crenobacter sp. SG2305]|uniref:ABC transporter permease n=1 Tax=Crenobacter oryzisoli TaxID=3056844 RepID=UPI0025AA43E6|nr:proline/glycine betaine ABC transporter permease [Crenobacter sp. SG2305]MDN0084051.1 proline/glycine betaine ABC transporter permease [Crenobacter sp. SG2305]
MTFPALSIKDSINALVNWLVAHWGDQLHAVSDFLLQWLLVPLESVLRGTPPWLVLLIVAGLAAYATRDWKRTALWVGLLFLIGCFGLWDALMQTLAIVLLATLLTVLIGLPLGIAMARNDRFRAVVLPVLDVMQTLPSFVYLIPVLMLFGLGKVPAIFATLVYALPPLARMTDLGIRQVDSEVLEAAEAFGSNRWQLLFLVQLPLARPSILAGVNQATMLALSMVVLASMIGARGLGEDVLVGIQTLDVGRGLQAGLAIVVLAIVMDRISQAFGQDRRQKLALSRGDAR